jgi:hypothetical protein
MGVGGQCHALAALPLGKRLITLCTGGWVGPWASLDRCGRSRPHWDLIQEAPSPWQVAIMTTLPLPTLAGGIRRL